VTLGVNSDVYFNNSSLFFFHFSRSVGFEGFLNSFRFFGGENFDFPVESINLDAGIITRIDLTGVHIMILYQTLDACS